MKMLTVIIETPKGKGQKYDFDPVSGYFKLNKVMPAGLVFPFDFGFIPGTTGGDGDPLDVLVISELETFTGCAVDCRIIGAIKATQKEPKSDSVRNDRFIAIPDVSFQYANIKKISDLPNGIMDQLENFFTTYNQQAGKSFKALERVGPKQAMDIIEQAKNESHPEKLIQLFLPLYDADGKVFPDEFYTSLNEQLTETFGGLTVYTRSPATGLWKGDDGKKVKDEILVYEVLTVQVDEGYWKEIKAGLQKKFLQKEILIVTSTINRI